MTDASYDRPDLIPAALWDRVHASIILGPFLVWAADEPSRALHAEQLAQWVRRYVGEGAAARAAARQAAPAPAGVAAPAAGMAADLPAAPPDPNGARGPLPEAAREAARQAHIPAAAAARLWER
jgi:hypothetical protein